MKSQFDYSKIKPAVIIPIKYNYSHVHVLLAYYHSVKLSHFHLSSLVSHLHFELLFFILSVIYLFYFYIFVIANKSHVQTQIDSKSVPITSTVCV